MDPQPSYPLLTTLFLLILAILIIRKRSKTSTASNLPPGPWKLPIIGNLHNVLFGSLPHHALRDLAKIYGPLMHLQLGEVSTVVVSSADVAREMMTTHDTAFTYRPTTLVTKMLLYDSVDIVFSPYGEYWRQLRRICTLELLSMKRVRSFQWIREEEVSNLVERIASNAGSPFNLTKSLLSLAYTTTAKAAFGRKCGSQERFILLAAETLKIAAGFDIAAIFPSLAWLHVISGLKPKLKEMHREIDGILEIIINEHREARANKTGESDATMDLIDVLLNLEESKENGFSFSTSSIKAVIFDMFVGGSESSTTVVDWAMVEMMKKPKILEKAQAEVRQAFNRQGKVVEQDLSELKFLNSVIKETLRLHPTSPLTPRECRESCTIHGLDIPAKTKVIVNLWAIGRDPKFWTEPEDFNPERFLESPIDYKGDSFHFIPFGGGRRMCPGMSFGLVNVEFQLAKLLYHFDWKLPNGMESGDLNMTESFGLSVRRKDDLYLIPTPYHPFEETPKN